MFVVKRSSFVLLAAVTLILGSTVFAASPLPVTSGLVAHFDANSITDVNNGQQVTRWTDLSGTGHDADRAGGIPTFVTNVINGKPVVRFDPTNTYFTFTGISSIRTVFWVLKEDPAASYNRFLLGHSTSWNFHRGHYCFWNSTWASPYVLGGTTRLNGAVIDGTTTEVPYSDFSIASLVTPGNVSAQQLTRDRTNAAASWHGDIAELIIYNRPLNTVEENMVGYYLTQKYGIGTTYTSATSAYATNPSPVDEATSIATTGVTLRWGVAFASAPKYDVWFGPKGSTIKVSSAQDANSYALGTLSQDQVYEWRIDVIDGGVTYPADANWTFRTILNATKVVEWGLESTYNKNTTHEDFVTNVTATASSQNYGSASDTLNDNGLYGMEHIVYPYGYSWITADGGGTGAHPVDGSTSGWGAWIAYQFDAVYAIGNMYIWNQNQIYNSDLTNRGLKNVTVQYSTNGSTWTTLGSYVIPKATGQNGMPPSLTVNFGGASAKYVVITAASVNGTWGTDPGTSNLYYALAKVRFGINGTTAIDVKTPDSANYTALDANGVVKGNPQIMQGMATTDHCMDFNGVNDSVILSLVDPGFPSSGDKQWSMNFYVYLDEQPSPYDMMAGFGALIGWPDGSARYIMNYGGNNNQIYFWGNNAYDLATGVAFDIAQWQMITVTYDGGSLKVYKNGQVIGSKKVSTFANAVPTVHLAPKNMASHTGRFKGKLDNFAIYKGVLSQSDINSLAQALPLAGNFNRDAVVDFKDFAILGDRWRTNTAVQQWPTLMLFDMEGPNALAAWSVPDTWNSGVATIQLIQGDVNDANDPNQPFGGTQAIRMTYDNSSGTNKWSSVDVNLAAPVDMTKYDLLRIHLKRHTGNSREQQMFFRGYASNGDQVFNIGESVYSTDTPAGVWTDGSGNGAMVIWSNQIPFARDVKSLKIGAYSWSQVGGTGTIDIDSVSLEKFNNCLGTILEGDFNADCMIDLRDLEIFADNWLKTE